MARPCRIQTGFPFTRVRPKLFDAGLATCPAYRRRVSLVRACALAAVLALRLHRRTGTRVDAPRRVVSLIPSLTEDLFAIGAGRWSSAFRSSPTIRRRRSVAGRREFCIRRRRADRAAASGRRRRHRVANGAGGRRAQEPASAPCYSIDDGFDDIFRDIEALGLLTGRDRRRARVDRPLARAHDRADAHGSQARARTAERLRRARNRADLHRRRYVVHRQADRAGRRYERGAHPRLPTGRISAEALLAMQPDVLVADPIGSVAIRARSARRGTRCAPSASIASHIFRTRRSSSDPVPAITTDSHG